MHRKY